MRNFLHNLLFCLVLVLTTGALNAQVKLSEYGRFDSIAVYQYGDSLYFPWAGGFNAPQFSKMNLNGDSLPDLLIFDRDGWCARPFLNSGDRGLRPYRYAPEYEVGFPKMWHYTLMRDYNHDGREDIFTSYNGDFRVFENTSTGFSADSLQFTQQLFKAPWDTTQLENYLTCKYYANPPQYIYTNVYNSVNDMPGIADVDRDGDLDILAFGNGSGSVYWYENKGADQGYPDELRLELLELCWGRFMESAIDFSMLLGSCKGLGPNLSGTRHSGGSSIYLNDMNCNGLTDIVFGDNDYRNMIAGFNTGMHSSANITNQDTSYPSSNVPVDVISFPAAYGFDGDNDGREDFVVAPNASELYMDKNQVQIYLNRGLDSCIRLARQPDPYLVTDLIDLGTNSHPQFFDLDQDGLTDILCGSMGYFDTTQRTFVSKISYFKNTGTAQRAEYVLATEDLLGAASPADTGLHPTFGDMDNDGDMDMLIASFDGSVYYYENQAASPQDSAVFVPQSTSYDQIWLGKNAHPYLFDVNNDNKLDLLVGYQGSSIQYFQNVGSVQVAHFDTAFMEPNFGGIHHSNASGVGNLTITIQDIDTAGKTIDTLGEMSSERMVFIGSSEGLVYLYDQFSPNTGAQFRIRDSLFLYTRDVSLSMADIDGDEKPDMIYGHRTGGLSILIKDGGNTVPQPVDSTVSVNESTIESGQFSLFPNPGTGAVSIKNPNNHLISAVEVWSTTGQLVQRFEELNNSQFEIINQKPGIYLIRITHEKGIFTTRYLLAP
ncbi:T9SS type A sorting domain-containing protein [bacterium SCSIO 12741]|nr:T9SS type A sorting domain-containing protein [bacterium SCSIO 12741]